MQPLAPLPRRFPHPDDGELRRSRPRPVDGHGQEDCHGRSIAVGRRRGEQAEYLVVPHPVVDAAEATVGAIPQQMRVRERRVPRDHPARRRRRPDAVSAAAVAHVSPTVPRRSVLDARRGVPELAPDVRGPGVDGPPNAGCETRQVRRVEREMMRMRGGDEAEGESSQRDVFAPPGGGGWGGRRDGDVEVDPRPIVAVVVIMEHAIDSATRGM